ncbi:hypothetical protein NUW58_g5451 [Xylaria curta]|uniref:Uncharacterized protein n=2 Tax=Xylaria curta TaxID=42375 RepID=A0ACC1MRX3_9PEZI|nr:hypothetical protein NUW58_g9901 [Xylaria curta]KAJ2985589.1 hypothetical protein NUW58_g5451 [Xylaria curta]
MSHSILITGGSGYLGGSLLARWNEANLPAYDKLFALVRTPEQAEAVKQYGAEPLIFDAYNEAEVRAAVVDNNISVVYHLIASFPHVSQSYFLKAMAEVKSNTGRDVHFLHAIDADNFVIEEAEKHGIRSYIFVPSVVYGEGEGFDNRISIQTVAIVRAAEAAKRVYRVDTGRPAWPVCHVRDNTNMYLELMRKILANENPGYGKDGYYLAASGSVAWDDLYAAMAKALAKRNIIDDATVVMANDQNLEAMGEGLGCAPDEVPLQLGGSCTLTADRGAKELGWEPLYKPEHILEYADAEVDFILRNKD